MPALLQGESLRPQEVEAWLQSPRREARRKSEGKAEERGKAKSKQDGGAGSIAGLTRAPG